MNDATPAYGLWGLVLINSVIFIFFAFTFFKPQTTRDWRSFGAFSAFLVALFTEMYGFPLTLYFLSGWLQSRYPNVDWLSHDAGHLLEMLFGWKANPHFGPFHILSNVLIVVGFLVISAAWRVLYEAQRKGALATTGPYAYVRHPQYVGFILVMFGFLLQWPTLLTLAMFPVLLWMYVRLGAQRGTGGHCHLRRCLSALRGNGSSIHPEPVQTGQRPEILIANRRSTMAVADDHSRKPPSAMQNAERNVLAFLASHGAPIVFALLLWYVLWWGHTPKVQTVEDAMQHVSWVGVIALVYVALQARAVLAQPRSGVVHSLVEILVSLLPLFVVGYAAIDWLRGRNELNVFQVIVMVQATLATLIDVVIFTWFSLRLNKLSIQAVETHAHRS